MQYQMIRHVQQGGTLTPGSGHANDLRVEILEYVQFGVMLLALVALALWMYRAYHNVHQLPLARPQYSTSMAAWGWVIPIMNLWLPYRIMQDIGRYTVRTAHSAQLATPARFRNAAAVWWTFHIGLLIISRVNAAFARAEDPTIEQLLRNTQMMMATQVFILFSFMAALAMLRAIARHEQDLLAAVSFPPNTRGTDYGGAPTADAEAAQG
ncbi:hypothetical protein GCM10022406_36220 [Hymenobacter algoricola]|uniref:DUF4328 domain-containing protein n=2 Tax=Hymenobacter algoricola TaxID=486267 RepID=A0ABP7NRL7_9BACT